MFKSLYNRFAKRCGRRLSVESLEARQVMTSLVADYFVGNSNVDTMGKVLQNSAGVQIPENYWSIDNVTVAPKNGTIQKSDDQKSWIYTPNPGFTGIETFTYQTHTPNGAYWFGDPIPLEQQPYTLLVAPAVESLTMERIGKFEVIAPYAAVPDWFHVTPNSNPSPLDVLANDRWNLDKQWLLGEDNLPSRPTLSLVSTTTSKHGGTISLSDDNKSLQYKPAAGFEGLDEFEYTVTDANGVTRQARVQVRVAPAITETGQKPFWQDEFQHRMLSLGLESIARQETPRIFQDFSVGVARLERNDSFALTSYTTVMQEAGVDEGDFVEADGRYAYWIATRSVDGQNVHTLTVLDSQAEDGQSAIVSQTRLAERPLAIYLHEHRLTIISTTEPDYNDRWAYMDIQPVNQIEFKTDVTVYDVTDPRHPSVLETSRIDGIYRESRMMDGRLYLFTDQIGNNLVSSLGRQWISRSESEYYRTIENLDEYVHRLETLDMQPPSVVSKWGNDGPTIRTRLTTEDFAISEFGYVESPQANAILIFDTTDQAAGVSHRTTLDKQSQSLYVTSEAIYVLSTRYDSDYTDAIFEPPHTHIDQFDISNDGLSLSFVASGDVPGYLLNRFSLDEHEGTLRVVTTIDAWGGAETPGTAVFSLEQEGDKLEVVGKLEGLAPNESLYSAMFVGDRAYLVTFLRVDPLHVIDLSDPTHPKELGELIIPGYSDRLLPISEDLIVGVGRNTDEQGWAGDAQVSLFNVSDPTQPIALSQYTLEGGRGVGVVGTASGAAWNNNDPHAARYYSELGILALPLQNFETNSSRLELLKIQPTSIQKAGEVSFENNGIVSRSILLSEELLAFSPSAVKKFNPNHLTQITTIDLTDGVVHQQAVPASPVTSPSEPGDNTGTANQASRATELATIQGKVSRGEWTWQNKVNPLDVNGDGQISPIDMLLTISELSRSENGPLAVDAVWQQAALERNELWQVDVNDDGFVSPLDALMIAEELNKRKR